MNVTKSAGSYGFGHIYWRIFDNWTSVLQVTDFTPFAIYLSKKIDIHFVSETKIDDTFPVAQFCVEGYSAP